MWTTSWSTPVHWTGMANLQATWIRTPHHTQARGAPPRVMGEALVLAGCERLSWRRENCHHSRGQRTTSKVHYQRIRERTYLRLPRTSSTSHLESDRMGTEPSMRLAYDSPVEWPLDEEPGVVSKLMPLEVSEETRWFLMHKCTWGVANDVRW